jgi:hypothetical protein
MIRLLGGWVLALTLWLPHAQGQAIEFESNGLKYQTLTKSGITIIYSHMPSHLHEYTILQVAVSNGSQAPYTIRPEDFTYVRAEAPAVPATPAAVVINMLMDKGTGGDVIKLVTTYEAAIYGNAHFKSTNGYESRRQAAMAAVGAKLKAAAAASALAFGQVRMKPGESTDGAVFFSTEGKPLAHGHLVVRTNTDVFEFTAE